MFKKLLTGASVIALGLVLANEVKAEIECNGVYLAGRGGISNPKIRDKGENLGGTKLEIDSTLLMLSGALGYRYNYVRAELEYIWRDKSTETHTFTREPFPGVVITSNSKAQFEYTSYMFNFYVDLSPMTWFTPFVHAGIGWTDLTYTFNYTGQPTAKYDENNFTWSAGAGISAKLTNRWNLDAGWRYFDFGKIDKARLDAHEIYGGLRYVL